MYGCKFDCGVIGWMYGMFISCYLSSGFYRVNSVLQNAGEKWNYQACM